MNDVPLGPAFTPVQPPPSPRSGRDAQADERASASQGLGMLRSDELVELLALGHETRSFEVKGAGPPSDRHLLARVARAVLAMANLRDGGIVCIGIDDDDMAAMQPGLSPADLTEWQDFDSVSAKLSRYCDPPVSFRLSHLALPGGTHVVVLDVDEFETTPLVCRRSYEGVLQEGMTYVRSRRKPESAPVPTSADMRELLDLAVTKGVREFVRRAGAAGLTISSGSLSVGSVDESLFDEERALAWAATSGVLDRIAGTGHSDVAIRPEPYDPERIAGLDEFLRENTVRLRGWPVPYVDARDLVQHHGRWIGQDVEPTVVPHVEAWRLCASQFLQRRVPPTSAPARN